MPSPRERDDVAVEDAWRVYDHAVADVRAQVDRQWDLTKFFILLGAGAIGAAAALLQASTSRVVTLLVVLLLAGGAATSMLGVRVMKESKRYYRAMVAKKTLIEERLGLTGALGARDAEVGTWSLGALATRRKVREILDDPDGYASTRLRRGSTTGWAAAVLMGLAAFNALGAGALAAAVALGWM